MHDMIPIDLLAIGQKALVAEFVGQPDLVHRLEELGLRRGLEVEMVRPGNPCIVRLGTQKLCFRLDPATSVLVTPKENV